MTGEDTEGVVRRERFSGGPARSFLSSLDADQRIFGADIVVDRAHVVMLAEQGIVGDDVAGEILAALDEIEEAGHGALPDGEDVHEAIETAVIDRVGEEGGRMHTARSRNDEVATCIRYRLRDDILDTLSATVDLREALRAVAREGVGTTMPGYTHLQPAQPITVAHWALSYEQAVSRDTERLLDAYGRIDRSPLGAAAFAGTTFDVDRARVADLLGFDDVLENSMDAASSRDFLLETTAALSTVATTLSGLAEDLILFANRGFVEVDDDYASTSSIMPQKKNPDSLELVRAVAGDAAGGVGGLATTLKGLPRAYNRDLQRATPHAWEAVDAVTEATAVAAGAVATADWKEDVLAREADAGFSTATGVADLLATNGLPFRTAHEVVAVAAENGADYDALETASQQVLGKSLESFVDPADVEAALDPAESVASRDSTGGPAPGAVEAHLEASADALAADHERVTKRRETLEAARVTLEEEVGTYV